MVPALPGWHAVGPFYPLESLSGATSTLHQDLRTLAEEDLDLARALDDLDYAFSEVRVHDAISHLVALGGGEGSPWAREVGLHDRRLVGLPRRHLANTGLGRTGIPSRCRAAGGAMAVARAALAALHLGDGAPDHRNHDVPGLTTPAALGLDIATDA
jgi:hypothetical protein